MNEHNQRLAEEIKAKAEKAEGTFAGYMEIGYRGESWPLDDAGMGELPDEVIDGGREPREHEARQALQFQGYEV